MILRRAYNIDIKTTASNSLVHALKIHSHGLFEAKQGAVFNEDSNDVDFRVESNGNANMLFVDGGNDAVIFGDASNTNPATSSTATHSCFKNGGSKLELSASSNPCLAVNRVNSEGTCVELRQAGGLRGSISVAGASASFNTSSDLSLIHI